MYRILFVAKRSWTALRMSRPLFVGSYLQVTWWVVVVFSKLRCALKFRAEKRSAQASAHPLSQAQGGLFCVLTLVCLFVTERVLTKTE